MSPRGKEQNAQMRAETLEKITQTAFEVFSEYGYRGATMKQMASVSGLSYGLVYHYFPSKESLFRQLVDISLDKSAAALNEGLDITGTAWEKIENLSAVLIRETMQGEAAKYFIIMLQALTQGKGIPGLLEYIETRSAVHYQKVVPVIAEAQAMGDAVQGDPVSLAAAYFSFIQGLSILTFQEGGKPAGNFAELLSNILRARGTRK